MTPTGVDIDLKAETAFLKFVSGHFSWSHAFKLLNIENAIGTEYADNIGGDDCDNSLSGLAGNDVINGYGGNDVVVGGAGNDCLSGDAGNDVILGDDGDDVAFGGEGLAKLFGSNGDDDLYGNAGNDYLSGGAGSDFLTGGTGRDIFDYDSLSEVGCGSTRDWIYDFTRGQDKIGLADIDANTKLAGNQAFCFAGYGGSFSSKGGEIKYFLYDVAGTAYDKTIIQGDVNGDCKVDFQIELQGLKTLYASDFIL